MSLVTGARQVLTEGFDPAESLELIARERATIVHGFDTHYKEPRRGATSASRATCRACAPGSARQVWRARSRSAAGARELFGPARLRLRHERVRRGRRDRQRSTPPRTICEASGYPAPGYEVRVVDPDTGRDQPAGTPGEILVRGYTLMRGYYNKPEATRGRDRRRRLDAHRRHGPAARRRPSAGSWGATRTCSRSAARTSIRWRSRPISCATRPSTWPRW